MSGQRVLGEDEPPRAGSGALLRYNSPLSAERARLLVEVIGERPVDDVLDVGCGWGTLLLDVLEDQPAARGTGIDLHEPDIQRARREADERGLGDRATFLAQDAADETTDAGLVLNIGAFHVFGTIPEAFSRLHMLTRPGGRLLFGAEYARHVPTDEELARVWEGTRSDDFHLLSDLLDRAIDAGFRPRTARAERLIMPSPFTTKSTRRPIRRRPTRDCRPPTGRPSTTTSSPYRARLK